MPPNYGPRYSEQFAGLYPGLARQYHAALVPFLLEGVALDPTLMQEDGLHPNARGEPLVLDTVWPHLEADAEEESLRGRSWNRSG